MEFTFPDYNYTQHTAIDRSLLQRCHEAAKIHNSKGKITVWAIATDKRGNVLGQAGNDYVKSHTQQSRWSLICKQPEREFLHAETLAIIRALKSRKEVSKLYVVRVDKSGKMKDSKPCSVCQTMLETEFPNVIVVYGKEN